MSKTLLSIAAAALIAAGLASVPAAAQTAPAAPAAKAPAHKMAMHHASHHKMGCYDYAWESQAQQDCLAGKPAAPMAKKTSAKAKKKKATS
jgi:hypothetical protein